MKNLIFGLTCVYLCLSAAQKAVAVPLTTGADFLLMTTGARPDGMGQAFSAVADDVNTLSFNPAGLGNIRIPEVGYGYESFVAGIQYDFIGAAIPIENYGVLGLGYIDMGTAPFNSTANPGTPSVTVEDRAFVAGWGRSFYDLHVGVSAKYILRQLDNVQGSGWAVDAGLRYRPYPYLTFAASLMNLGPGIQLSSLESLPTVVNLGAAWTAVEKPEHTLNLAANAALDIGNNTQQFGVGAEYWYKDTVALRAGYQINSIDTEFNPDGFAAGAGLKIPYVELDYSFQPFNTLGLVNRFSGLLRWDGPWMPNTEPESPKYVNVHKTPKALEIRWEKSLGAVRAYEVLIQPLDGRPMMVSKPVINPIYYFDNFDTDTLYKISVRAIGPTGVRSFPSRETYAVSPTEQEREGAQEVKENLSTNGVNGEVDTVGLRLSWDAPAGFAAKGYNIYRRSPFGQIVKVTLEPKHDTKVWLTDVTGLQGWEWLVTAVGEGDKEKVVGTYAWFPSKAEVDSLLQKPTMRLNASPQADRSLYLDWDGNAEASGYALLASRQPDNIYEFLKDIDKPVPNALLQIPQGHDRYYFIVVPKDAQGHWMKRSKEAIAEFLPTDE